MQKPDTWWNRYPFVYALCLLPILVVASGLRAWFRLSERFDYCLAIRINGEVRPIEVDLTAVVVWFILLMGFALLAMTWAVALLWRQRRTLKEIWEIRQRGQSQHGACA
jgi:uncharacterized iron-regulated membrane protein